MDKNKIIGIKGLIGLNMISAIFVFMDILLIILFGLEKEMIIYYLLILCVPIINSVTGYMLLPKIEIDSSLGLFRCIGVPKEIKETLTERKKEKVFYFSEIKSIDKTESSKMLKITSKYGKISFLKMRQFSNKQINYIIDRLQKNISGN